MCLVCISCWLVFGMSVWLVGWLMLVDGVMVVVCVCDWLFVVVVGVVCCVIGVCCGCFGLYVVDMW